MKKRVLIFGDSNTWGWKPENTFDKAIERFDDEVRWAGVLQAELGDDYLVIADGLNGRTTVWDDPIEEYRCGKYQIIPTMNAQAPFDLVIIMVGTNDLKVRYTVSAEDIANGAGLLVDKALSQAGDFTGSPKVLLVAPPPLGPVEDGIFAEMFWDNQEKSVKMAKYYEGVAAGRGVEFFNAADHIVSSKLDGLHLDADQHEKLGKAIAPKVKEIIG